MILLRHNPVDTSKAVDMDIRQRQGFGRSERGPPLSLSEAEAEAEDQRPY